MTSDLSGRKCGLLPERRFTGKVQVLCPLPSLLPCPDYCRLCINSAFLRLINLQMNLSWFLNLFMTNATGGQYQSDALSYFCA